MGSVLGHAPPSAASPRLLWPRPGASPPSAPANKCPITSVFPNLTQSPPTFRAPGQFKEFENPVVSNCQEETYRREHNVRGEWPKFLIIGCIHPSYPTYPKRHQKSKKHVLGEKQPLNANTVVSVSLQAVICRRQQGVVHSQQDFQASPKAASSP